MTERQIGTAGWTLPRDLRERFEGSGTQLERYAREFSCVEINSSFYRPHRPSTYGRWARSVPETFRFSLKLPREITHVRRLVQADAPLKQFLEESSGLGEKRGVLLVQLPPSFAFEAAVAEAFFRLLRSQYDGRAACEPRHASWYETEADACLDAFAVARVAADPPPVTAAVEPGGARDWSYMRLHGTPVIYRSSYDESRLATIAANLRRSQKPAWCIFDNTTFGAATANALRVKQSLR